MPRVFANSPSRGAGRGLAVWKPAKNDLERVRNLALLGLPDPMIAACIGEEGIGVDLLHRHFGKELKTYRQEQLGKIAKGAYRMALPVEDGGDKTIPPDVRARMMMFVLKTRGGWREADSTVINAHNVQIVKRVVGVSEDEL